MGSARRLISRNGRRQLLVGLLGVSAGVHVALVPEHLEEAPVIGWSFIPASIAAALVASSLVASPMSVGPPRLAAALLAGLIVAYAVAISVAVPGVEGTPEAVEPVAVIDKLLEALGVGIALTLSRPGAPSEERVTGAYAGGRSSGLGRAARSRAGSG